MLLCIFSLACRLREWLSLARKLEDKEIYCLLRLNGKDRSKELSLPYYMSHWKAESETARLKSLKKRVKNTLKISSVLLFFTKKQAQSHQPAVIVVARGVITVLVYSLSCLTFRKNFFPSLPSPRAQQQH